MPLADVYVHMPGASAKEVEKLVATPLEKLLWQVDGVRVRLLHVPPRPGHRHRSLLRRGRPHRLPGQAAQQDRHPHRPGPAGSDRLGRQAGGRRRRSDRQPHPLLEERFGLPAAPCRRGGGGPAAVGAEHLGDQGHRRPPPADAGGDSPGGDGRPGHHSARCAPGSERRQPAAAGGQLSA